MLLLKRPRNCESGTFVRVLVGAITKAIPVPVKPERSGTIANTNWVEKEKAELLDVLLKLMGLG